MRSRRARWSSTPELDHAGVHVADVERSVAFYCDVLGLREHTRLSLGDEALVFLAAGAGWIELIHAPGAPRSAGIVDHLALRVDDLDALLDRLRAASVRLLDEAPLEVPQIDARIAFVLGPDGERVELSYERFDADALEGSGDPAPQAFLALVKSWMELTGVLNELSRSMGVPDFYPFVLSPPALRKLHLVHRVVGAASG